MTDTHLHSDEELTDSDFHIVRLQLLNRVQRSDHSQVRFGLGEFQLAMSAFLATPIKTYDLILNLDTKLQEVVRRIPTTNYSANGRCKPICRSHGRQCCMFSPKF